MYEVSLFLYLIVFLFIIRTRNVLLMFLFIAYTLQFWALFFNNDQVVFWPNAKYTFSKTHPIATVEPLKLELSEFLNSLDSRKKPIADASVGLKMIKIYEAVKKSAEQKKEIFLTN